MTRKVLLSTLLAACICMRPVSAFNTTSQAGAGAAQTAPAVVDRALVERFAAASDADRDAMIAQHAEILSPPFVTALSALGSAHRNDGDLPVAEGAFSAILHIGRHHNQPRSEISGILGLASVEGSRSELLKSLRYAEEGLALSTSAGFASGRQTALNYLNIVKRRLGDLDGALKDATQSEALARDAGDRLVLARALNNKGNTYLDLGQAADAIAAQTEALRLKEQSGADPTDLSTTLTNIGNVYATQGDYALASDYYLRALAQIERSGRADMVTSVYNNLGQLYSSTFDYTKARMYLDKAIALAERIPDAARVATALYIVATIDRDEGHLDAAEAAQRRALALREETRDRLGIVESLTEIASLLDARGRSAEGLPYGERAIALAAESRLANQLWKAQLVTGIVHLSLGHETEARALYAASIKTLEALRLTAAGGTRAQQHLMTERLGPYYALAALDIKTGQPFAALAGADRARARALTDLIASGRVPSNRLTTADRDEERRLTAGVLTAVAALENEARRPGADARSIAPFDAQLAAARNAREEFLEALYTRIPEVRFARGDTPALTRERLLATLTPGTGIVSFVLGEGQAWAFLVTRGPAGPNVRPFKLTMTSNQVAELAETFAGQIASRDLSFAPTARKLYDTLFGSFDGALANITSLVIAPDGPLWRVPFQALRTPRNRFLIEERPISYTPSLTALAALEDRRRSRTPLTPFLVALGDPAIASAAEAGSGPGNAQRGSAVARLPEAAREVRAIGGLYGTAKSAVLVDTAASERAIRELVSHASVLHVATHGFLENTNPMYSHLMLAPSGADASRDHTSDGRLEAWEVLDMDIRANVAVLSACQSAGGAGFGEGVVGLSWSLFAAGASTAPTRIYSCQNCTQNMRPGFPSTAMPTRRADEIRCSTRDRQCLWML